MASAPAPPVASTKETTNYARLCRLLVDVGTQALRETFDRIHPPAGLHLVLAHSTTQATLQSLRKKGILNPTQWGMLYPAIVSSVTSASFDTTLLMVLLRNICHLTPPVSGWDKLPSAADMSTEANIARVKYYRNTVYGHVYGQGSVDDATFNRQWQDISNALVALGGARYRAAINKLKNEAMDPYIEVYLKELLMQWKRDEDSIKEILEEMQDKMSDNLNQMKRERTISEYVGSPTTSGEVPPEIVVRGRLALEAYNKALAEGKTFDKRVPVMLIGRFESGKTSLKRSLRGEDFKQNVKSTVGIDVDPSHFELSTEIWTMPAKDQETKTSNSYEHHIARATVEHMMQTRRAPVPVLESPPISAITTNDFTVDMHGRSTHDPVESGSMSSSSPKTIIQDNRSDRTSNEPNELQIADSKPDIPNDIQTEMIKFLENDSKVEDEEVHSVLWDFARQSVYYTTHPIFLTSRAIYLLAYDLSQNPHQKAEAVPKQGQFEPFSDSCGLEFNSDYLDFWMSSVASLECQEESDRVSSKSKVLPEKLPAVFLVCTHADTPYDRQSDAKTLGKKLYGSLQTKPYMRHLHDVFVVDNTKSGSGSECPEVKRLREELLTVAKELPQMKEPIPIRWLNYEKSLQAKRKRGEKWIDLQEAKRTASEECNIVKDEEFQTVLNFFHDRRILIHFSDTKMLDKFVVLDPQWLIDVFKKVITIPPHNSKENKFRELWFKLQRKGILEKKLLDHVWSMPSFDKETTESLLGIMEKFSLLCSWCSSDASCEKQYLVPSMLTTYPTEDIMKLVEAASEQIPPLVVKFKSGLVPPGLFPRLVLLFLQWGKENCVNPVKPLLYHNFARCFISEDTSQSVVLLCLSSSIKVVVHRGNGIQESGAGCLPSMTSLSVDVSYDNHDVTFASSVCRQLELILETMRNEFCWLKNMRYELSFICPVCCEGGILGYCDNHKEQGCKQEECFHFWSLSELRTSKKAINCHESATAEKTQIDIRQFAPWLVSSRYQFTVGEHDEGGLANLKGKEISLPDEVQKSLSSPSCDAKAVVLQLKETKQLNQASLKEPDLETKTLIQCFVRKAKDSNRRDVVLHLREITPAGTTGPLLREQLNVQDIPVPNRKDLTINLSGGEEWKEVAERLGLTSPEIRFLDNRTLNPFDATLAFIAKRKNITVANLYDLLNECGYPMIADLL